MKRIIYYSIAIVTLSPPISIHAQISIGRNHPELVWKVIETPHFKVIYHRGIERIAEEVARVAEEIYPPITEDLGIEPKGKTPIIVSDYDDISNGMASPLGHHIFIWAKSFKKYTTGRMKWLRRVVAHEFTHQLNFWGLRAFPGTLRELLALGFMPNWFIEGLAQYEGEHWDHHRDMLLRVAAANQALLPPKKLEGFIGTDRIDSRLVYEQGHSLVRYIAVKYGRDKVPEIIKKHRSLPISFNLSLKRAIGVGEKKLFKQWRREIAANYLALWKQKEHLEQIAERFPSDLQGNYGLRWSPDGGQVALVGVEEFDEEVPRLYLFKADGSEKRKIAGPYVSSFFSWSPDGRYILYSKKRRGRNGSLVDDLFLVDVKTGKNRPLTYNLRATDPDWSPEGKRIVFSLHQGPLSNLALLDLKSKTLKLLTSFENWTEVFTPDWSPNGDRIVFSIFDKDGKRDIAVVDSNGSNFRKLTDDFYDDRYPVWSPDGEKIAFISYRNGIPNLYLINPDGSGLTQVTDVAGGVFNPTWTPDGKAISVVAFERTDRIDVFTLPADRKVLPSPIAGLTDWKRISPHRGLGFPEKSSLINLKRYPYNSLSSIRSQLTLPWFGEDDTGLQIGICNLSADPLGDHTLLWVLTHRRRTDFLIDYVNTQFLPTINLRGFSTTLDRGTFAGHRLWERHWGFSAQLWLPFNFGRSLLSDHLVWISTSISKIETIDQDKFSVLRPFQGWVNTFNLGYCWSYSRPDVAFSINPKSGAGVNLSFKWAALWLQSDLKYTEIRATVKIRRELPVKEHVLALQLCGCLHRGDQPIQNRIALGSSALRGLTRSIEGDKFLYSNLEYRLNLLRDLGLKVWLLYLERLAGALFLDLGKAWGVYLDDFKWKDKNFSEVDLTATAGAELRLRVYLAGKISLVFRGGYGMELPDKKGEFYWAIGPVF